MSSDSRTEDHAIYAALFVAATLILVGWGISTYRKETPSFFGRIWNWCVETYQGFLQSAWWTKLLAVIVVVVVIALLVGSIWHFTHHHVHEDVVKKGKQIVNPAPKPEVTSKA